MQALVCGFAAEAAPTGADRARMGRSGVRPEAGEVTDAVVSVAPSSLDGAPSAITRQRPRGRSRSYGGGAAAMSVVCASAPPPNTLYSVTRLFASDSCRVICACWALYSERCASSASR